MLSHTQKHHHIGPTIVVSGASFGINPTVTLNGVSLTLLAGQTHSQLSFALPQGDGRNLPLVINVAGQSTQTTLGYNAPQVTSVNPRTGPTQGGTTVTFLGSNFGPSPSVFLDDKDCTNVQVNNEHTQLTVDVPAGTGLNKAFYIEQDSNGDNSWESTTNDNAFRYGAPQVDPMGLSVTGGSAEGGYPLVITGTNFGALTALVSVSIGSRAATVTAATHTSITATVPSGVGSNLNVDVTVEGQTATAPQSFTYSGPEVSGIVPNTGTTEGAYVARISGSGFGASGPADVTVGGVACSALANGGPTGVDCTIPAGIGVDRPVVVTTASGPSDGAVKFSYASPTLSSIVVSNGPTIGNTEISLTGTNFGPANTAAQDITVTIGDSPNPCTRVSQDHTSYICR